MSKAEANKQSALALLLMYDPTGISSRRDKMTAKPILVPVPWEERYSVYTSRRENQSIMWDWGRGTLGPRKA